MALTKKQQRFVDEYLIDLNGKQAAIRAGYTVRRAEVTASELIANRKVSEAITQKMQIRAQRTGITQDRVLQELARIAFFDIRRLYNEDGGMKAPHELDDDAAAVLAGVDVTEEFEGRGEDRKQIGFMKKAKIFDKGTALTLAMRHLGMLKDKVEHSGGLTLRRSAQELTDDELAAIAAGGGEGAADQA
ncbi:terminase small subunit [Variovorax sp. PAMC26660]|uniref:terminase small subunit n=1 Tax=Variovorax sp. PAMC26660 TaxID=2762322 RepID=UPI00164D06EF|nr:terminase small subunit [Variovorax sp. PAMC26660]QNK65890.1 terminase small subunit [Variovorax sp. PAMC26660]